MATGDGASRALLERYVDRTYLALCSFQPRRPIAPSMLSDEHLRRLPERTLFIAGSHDRTSDASSAAARIRNAAHCVRIALIAGAGHDVASARAERVDALLLEHLDSGPQLGLALLEVRVAVQLALPVLDDRRVAALGLAQVARPDRDFPRPAGDVEHVGRLTQS